MIENLYLVEMKHAQQLLDFDESFFYLSYLKDDLVATSAVFHDTTRLSLLLSALHVEEDLRETLTKHVIRNSLPFFRSVAIREVDAFVAQNDSNEELPYPLIQDIGKWAVDSLVQNGFQEVEEFERVWFQTPAATVESTILQQEASSLNNLKQFYWDIPESERPDHSALWFGVFLGNGSDSNYVVKDDEGICASLTLNIWEHALMVSSIMHTSQRVPHDMLAKAICHAAQKNECYAMVLNHTKPKSRITRALEDICGEPIKVDRLKLYRKKL